MNKLEEIVEDVYPRFKGMDELFNKYSRERFITFCHGVFTSGGISMQIRNSYNLWDQNSDAHKYFKAKGIEHPDDMSAEIVGKVWDKFHNN